MKTSVLESLLLKETSTKVLLYEYIVKFLRAPISKNICKPILSCVLFFSWHVRGTDSPAKVPASPKNLADAFFKYL